MINEYHFISKIFIIFHHFIKNIFLLSQEALLLNES